MSGEMVEGEATCISTTHMEDVDGLPGFRLLPGKTLADAAFGIEATVRKSVSFSPLPHHSDLQVNNLETNHIII